MTRRKTIEVVTKEFPDIDDIIAQKARGRQERALLSFGEKLEILDKLREQVAPIIRTRQIRRALEEARVQSRET